MKLSMLDKSGKSTRTQVIMQLLCLFYLLGHITVVDAITSSLVLEQSSTVIRNQLANYTCAATGNGPDPSFIWTIRSSPNNVLETFTYPSSSEVTIPEVDTNANDGTAKSRLQILVTESRENQTVWCGAQDVGRSSITMEIFASLNITSTSVALGGTCTTSGTTNCGQNAYCDSGTLTCRCTSSYYDSNGSASGGTCIIRSTLGNSCVNVPNSCAAVNSACNSSNICACNANYVQSGLVCIADTSAGLGQSCTNPTRNCVVSNSICTGGTCQCNTGYYQSGTATCTTQSSVGANCNSLFNTSCSTTNSFCSSSTNRCTCPSGYVYTVSTNSCDIPILGQACTSTVGCRSLSTGQSGTTTPQCSSTNICQCPSSYYSYTNVCYLQAGVGGNCNTQVLDSCSDSNSLCQGGTCTCNTGYSENASGTCVVVTGTDYCTADTQVPDVNFGTDDNFPDVKVNKRCYEVSLYGTVVLHCEDSKGTSARQDAGWNKLPGNVRVIQATGRYINGDFATPSLTFSNTQSFDDGFYVCFICYAKNLTNCTYSDPVELQVNGTVISSVTTVVSTTTPVAGNPVTFTCTTLPANVGTSYEWLRNGVSISNLATFTISSIQSTNSGTYTCIAANEFGSVASSNQQTVDVQYRPQYTLADGSNTTTVFGNLGNGGTITITCAMDANPPITRYRFYDALNRLLSVGTANTFQVTSSFGYGTYRCEADNSVGTSDDLFFNVQLQQTAPSTGASTSGDSISTGAIAAIVIGIIFLILLIIIIIICCCNYGWCRKKEKTQIEPVIVEQPKVRPYIPRSVVSATSSTVSRRDVGVEVNGHANVVSEEVEEPRYASPRYYLRPASDAGPIISMYDKSYDQPRAHQLPALDTQYLYTDEAPKKRHKKRRRKKTRRSYHEEEQRPVPETPSPPENDDEDLIVVPGKHHANYFE